LHFYFTNTKDEKSIIRLKKENDYSMNNTNKGSLYALAMQTSAEVGVVENEEELPTARLISSSAGGAEYSQDDNDNNNNYNNSSYGDSDVIIRDAIPIPVSTTNQEMSTLLSERERAVARLAAYRGRIQAEQELEDIQRAARNIRAIQYYSEREVEEANRQARERMRAEEYGMVHEVARLNQAIALHESSKQQPPASSQERQCVEEQNQQSQMGTFGKEYEVSKYDTMYKYNIGDYKIAEYKSVYER
jgi:hypothetical protein